MPGRAWGPVRRETVKILFQRRSYVIWAGAALVPFLTALALRLAGGGGGDGDGPPLLGRAFENGMYLPIGSLIAVLYIMLPLAAAMVGGYAVAGEAELGTLRIILLRPVHRGSMLLTKWVVAVLYLAAGAVIMLTSALFWGGLFFGLHPVITLSGSTLSVGEGLWVTVLAYLYGLAAITCVLSLALLLSTLTDSSLTALIGTFIIYLVLQILIALSYFDWLRPWVFAAYYDQLVDFLRDPIAWRPILKGLGVFAAWSGVLTTAAWLLFRRKDVLS
jgi:ABC-2 type transport system permease protein